MRRGCLLSVVIVLGLCVVGCGAIYFILIPRIQDEAADALENAISTEVADRLVSTPGAAPSPGSYVITAVSLRDRLESEVEDSDAQIEDLILDISPVGIEIGFDTQDQDFTYSGGVIAENGELRLIDFEASNGIIDFVFPADKMAEAIEDAVNNYLAENNLRLASVELREGEMVLVTEAAS